MRLSVVTFLRPGTEPRDRPLGRIVDYARRIEKRGFPGIWVTDSVGRGRPTLDPLVALGVLSAATERVDGGDKGGGRRGVWRPRNPVDVLRIDIWC